VRQLRIEEHDDPPHPVVVATSRRARKSAVADARTLAATITSELLAAPCPNESDRPEGRSQVNDIAGAGFEPATFGL
jgi:hypothetical protein